MIFRKITLKNFKSFSDAEQELSLDHSGIKLITGINGIGKSTIFEAVLWCLYGKSLQETAEDVINRYTKKNCKVSVVFEIGGVSYTVYRYRAHETHGNSIYIFQGEKNISMKNANDTQSIIQEIIQLPFTAMTNSIIFSSELYSSFLRSKTGERLKTFESVLSLKEIGTYYDIVKKNIGAIDEQIGIHNEKIGKAQVGIDTIRQTIDQYKEKAKTTLTNLKQERADILVAIELLNSEIQEMDKIDVSNELSNIEKTEHNNAIREKIKSEKEKLINISTLEIQLSKLMDKIDKLKQVDIKKETAVIDEYEKKKKELDDINNEIKENSLSVTNVDAVEFNIQEALKKLKNEQNNLNHLQSNAECPVCHQEVKDDKKEELKNLYEKNIKEFITFRDEALFGREKILNNNKVFEDKIAELKKRITPLPIKYLYTREQLVNIADDLNKVQNELSVVSTQVEEGVKFNDNINKSVLLLEKEIYDVSMAKYSKDFLIDLNNRKEIKKNLIQEHTNRLSVIDESAKNVYDKSFVESNEKKVKAIQAILSEEENTNNGLNDERKYYDILFTLFSNKESGFKKYFIGKMIGFFNESINFYLPFFFEKEVRINFDKELNDTITIDGMQVSFKSFSAGMKTRAEIAVAFSLFQLSKTFFSSDTNLLVFDELLDMNLDSAGFEAVIEVIKGMADNSIFIISHQDAIKDSFDDVVQIDADSDGFTRIS